MTDQQPVPHGTGSRYSYHGCRCELCTEAHRNRAAETRRKRRAAVAAGTTPVPHGTANGYQNYYCRCDDCREAERVWQRQRRGRAA